MFDLQVSLWFGDYKFTWKTGLWLIPVFYTIMRTRPEAARVVITQQLADKYSKLEIEKLNNYGVGAPISRLRRYRINTVGACIRAVESMVGLRKFTMLELWETRQALNAFLEENERQTLIDLDPDTLSPEFKQFIKLLCAISEQREATRSLSQVAEDTQAEHDRHTARARTCLESEENWKRASFDEQKAALNSLCILVANDKLDVVPLLEPKELENESLSLSHDDASECIQIFNEDRSSFLWIFEEMGVPYTQSRKHEIGAMETEQSDKTAENDSMHDGADDERRKEIYVEVLKKVVVKPPEQKEALSQPEEEEPSQDADDPPTQESTPEPRGSRDLVWTPRGYRDVVETARKSLALMDKFGADGQGLWRDAAEAAGKLAEKQAESSSGDNGLLYSPDDTSAEGEDLTKALYTSVYAEALSSRSVKLYTQYHETIGELVDTVDEARDARSRGALTKQLRQKENAAVFQLREMLGGNFGDESIQLIDQYDSIASRPLDVCRDGIRRRRQTIDQFLADRGYNRGKSHLEKSVPHEREAPQVAAGVRRPKGIGLGSDWDTGEDSDYGEFGLPRALIEEVESYPLETSDLRREPKPYQLFAMKYILTQKNVLLGDEMGLGKTFEAIGVMASIARQKKRCKFLVVCPVSVIKNWEREIKKFIGNLLPVYRLHGLDRDEMFYKWKRGYGIGITSYGTLGKLCDLELLKKARLLEIDLIVVDEAHRVKNPGTAQTKVVRAFNTVSDRILYMTGTPLENKAEEMGFLIGCLRPDIKKKLDKFDWAKKPEKFRETIAPVYLRRRRVDVLDDLPEKREIAAWCEMTREDSRAYRAAVESGNFQRMRRVSFDVKDPASSSKIARLRDICEKAEIEGRKVLVFSFFRDTIKTVSEAMGDKCVGVINGSVSPNERQRLVDRLEYADDGSVLVCNPLAGGVGLNIQSASVVVLCEPQFKPSEENQAISRVYRTGQKSDVVVYRLLCAESIDEYILEILNEKQKTFDLFADRSSATDGRYAGLDVIQLQRELVARAQREIGADQHYDDSDDEDEDEPQVDDAEDDDDDGLWDFDEDEDPWGDDEDEDEEDESDESRDEDDELIDLNEPLFAEPEKPEDQLTAEIHALGLETVDKRPAGCLWVVGGASIAPELKRISFKHGVRFHFAKNGARSTGYRQAWYMKL